MNLRRQIDMKTRRNRARTVLPACAALLLAIAPVFAGPFDASNTKTVMDRCHQGDATLCTSAGHMYRRGTAQVPRDLDKAIEYYGLACRGGDRKGCHALYEVGFELVHGRRTAHDPARAARAFAPGCEGSARGVYSGAACQELGLLYLNGSGVARDDARGVQLLRRGCDDSSRRACRDLGDVLLQGKHAPRDAPGALAAYVRGCSGKNAEPRACKEAGLLYYEGRLVPRDVAAAEQYLTGGCTSPKQYGSACYALAMLYDKDLPGRKTDKEITGLMQLACDRAPKERSGAACVAAAARYETGKGATPDRNMVANLYSRGCQLKYTEACRLSCELHCKGGQPHACAAVKSGKYPVGVANCYKP